MTEERQPTRLGLCPDHYVEFYMPDPKEGDKCSDCDLKLVHFVPAANLDKALAALREIAPPEHLPRTDEADSLKVANYERIARAALKDLDGLREPA